MDPDENLKNQRETVAQIIYHTERQVKPQVIADEGYRLAELVQALDDWIAKDGFLPYEWKTPAEKLATNGHPGPFLLVCSNGTITEWNTLTDCDRVIEKTKKRNPDRDFSVHIPHSKARMIPGSLVKVVLCEYGQTGKETGEPDEQR